ncbi:MAG: FHA domain-containing protein [Planctomycetota bacterium]|nr:FHA domain-containing protein [Planctomycetota bacterium]
MSQAQGGTAFAAERPLVMQRIPTLVGTGGHFAGEIHPLEYGKTISVGRSRSADFSLRRTQKYREQDPNTRETDASAKTVSGKHFEITMYNLGSIEIRNLSSNGTFVDGKRIDSAIVDDVAKTSHEIRFGQNEILKLEMRVHEDL